MSSDELRSMLGLGEQDQAADGSVQLDRVEEASREPPSDYALRLDAWGKRKGRELMDSEIIHPLKKSAQELNRAPGVGIEKFPHTLADFYGACFEPDPLLEERCVSETRHEFMKAMLETSEYMELHQHTMMSDVASEIACASFLKQYIQLHKESGDKKQPPSDLDQMRAAGRALKEAGQEVKNMEDACNACGLGQGTAGSGYDTRKMLEIYKKVRSSQQLQRIFNRAGKYIRFAAALQRTKEVHGMDDMVGVALGGNVASLLPSELMKLAVPELELDLMRQLLEKQALIRMYQAFEKVGKGYMIMSVDESGSMGGQKIVDAKALALAFSWLAQQQGRGCALLGFSGGHEGHAVVKEPGKAWDQDKLFAWLEHFYGGGTTLDVPVAQMPAFYHSINAPPGRTDLCCVTDGLVNVPEGMAKEFNAWKQEAQARMITLIIGGSGAGNMPVISDEVHLVGSLSEQEQGVQQVLQI